MKNYDSVSWLSSKLELRKSSIHGNGVFTNSDIAKGEMLIVWGGVVFSSEDVKQGKAKQHTMVGIDEELYLAIPESEDLSIDDYMNHSCDPNIWMKDEVTLIAKKNINAGEELTADYALWLNNKNYKMKNICNCGYKFCRKLITGEDWMLKQVQILNMNHFSPFINNRINKLKVSKMNILITGGSRGIGKAIAKELALSNHNLLLISKNESNLLKAKEEIKALSNSKTEALVCDISKYEDLQNLSSYCSANFVPDVLILSAGIFIEGSLTGSKTEDFEETMNVNLLSAYHIVKLFVNGMKERGYGKIILIGSTASLEAYGIGALYGVAKWALKGYAVNLRHELKQYNVGVTLINPGGTLTDLWAGEELPANRLLEPSDIGKLINAILTLSDQAVVEELIVRPMLGDIHE